MDEILSATTVPLVCLVHRIWYSPSTPLSASISLVDAAFLPTTADLSIAPFVAILTSVAICLAQRNFRGLITLVVALLIAAFAWSLSGKPLLAASILTRSSSLSLAALFVPFAVLALLAYRTARSFVLSWPREGRSFGVQKAETAVMLQGIAVAISLGNATATAPLRSNSYAFLSLSEQASIVTAVLAAGTALAVLALVPAVKNRVVDEEIAQNKKTGDDGDERQQTQGPSGLLVLYKRHLPWFIAFQLLAFEYVAFFFILRREPVFAWVLGELILAHHTTQLTFAWLLFVTAVTIGCIAFLQRLQNGGELQAASDNAATARDTSTRALRRSSTTTPPRRRRSNSSSSPSASRRRVSVTPEAPANGNRLASLWVALPLARRNLIVRKAFHVAALVLFAPPLLCFQDSGPVMALMKVASVGAFHVFALVELMRAALPPLSANKQPARRSQRKDRNDASGCVARLGALLGSGEAAFKEAVEGGMKPFTDERDEGAFIVTHLYLIAGCGLPLWLAPFPSSGGSAVLLPLAGILSCMGDGAAAFFGVLSSSLGFAVSWEQLVGWLLPLGRDSNPTSLRQLLQRKTVNGTLGFVVVASLLSALFLACSGDNGADGLTPAAFLPALWAATFSAAVETLTVGVDNLLLPLIYWLWLLTLPAISFA